LVLNTLVHEFLVVAHPLAPLPLLVLDVVTTAANAGACWLLLQPLRIDPRLPRLRDVGWFVAVACVGAPLGVALLQVLNLAAAGLVPWPQVVERLLHYWAGDGTGVGLLAPPLLLVLRRWPRLWAAPPPDPAPPAPAAPSRRWPTRRAVLEGVAEAVAVALALVAGYGSPRGGTLDYSYALFVPLLWIAARHGFARTAATVLALNVGVALLVRDEIGHTNGLALQFGLLTVTLSGLLLGAFMSERRLLGAHQAHQALHDPLTDLGNRTLFIERVAHALARRSRPDATLAVLFVDLDNFKAINDSRGHAVGDEILVAVGRRLAACVRPADTVARLGGDEFAVLLDDLSGLPEAGEVAARLLDALRAPVAARGTTVVVGGSVGIAFADAGADDTDTLLRNADVALYRAKDRGRGGYQVFDASMHAAVVARLELEADLRGAIDREEFVLHYQPLVVLATGRIVGVEALVRWAHPTRGLLAPGAFIPLAEETGLIAPLGRWVLRAASRTVAGWPTPAGAPLPTVGVNLSVAQMQQEGVLADVAAALRETGLAPDRLMLEITESVLAGTPDMIRDTLRALRGLGVRLALDDFGTGYASLSYLRRFPLDDLKMDRSFVADLGRDATATELTRVIVALGHTLGLVTVAEGIETAEQYARVRALGCARGQGYYISPPLPSEDARALVAAAVPLAPPV